MSVRRCLTAGLIFSVVLLFQAAPIHAVTVYFQDGTHMEVENISRVGDTVCLFVDISQIDTTRTVIQDLQELPAPEKAPAPLSGLSLENIDFSSSEDERDIIATGEVINHSAYSVQNVRVIVTLQDKDVRKLLEVQGYVRPGKIGLGPKRQLPPSGTKAERFLESRHRRAGGSRKIRLDEK